MAYKQYPVDKYVDELHKKLVVQQQQIPIIQKYNAELRAKIKPTVGDFPPTATESEMRSILTTELSKVLKASDVPNVIEHLAKANDLKAFYNFSKLFLAQVKDVRNLDASYILNLWSRFKSKMLIVAETSANAPPFQGQTAAEYERAIKRNEFTRESRERSQMGEEDINRIKPRLKIDTSKGMSNLPVYEALNPEMATHMELESNPYGYRIVRGKKDDLTKTFSKAPRKNPVQGSLLLPGKRKKHIKGGAIIGQTYLSRR